MAESSRHFETSLPILTRYPLQQRNATTSEDYEDTEAGTDDDDGGILTPTTSQARETGLDDMPPTYEQAQAHSVQDARSTKRSPWQSFYDKPGESATGRPVFPITNATTTPGLTDHLHPPTYSHPARISEFVCVAIPPLMGAKQNVQFVPSYSLRLSNLGLSSAIFYDFIDGMNAVLRHSPTVTTSRQAVLSLADSADEARTSTAAQLSEYLHQANTHLFGPKGLSVTLQTATDLLESVIPQQGNQRQVRAKVRRSVWDAKSEREAAASLTPHVEPLTWNAPIRVSHGADQSRSQYTAPARREGSDDADLRAIQCPWEADDLGGDSPNMLDWYPASETTSSAVFTPATSQLNGRGGNREELSAQSLALMLDDSGTDSDASTHSNTESRIHASNSLAEAHRHYASVVAGIERKARDKIFGLGDSPRHGDLVKYEGKRCAKLNHAAATRHSAEIKYSVATMQRRQRRANKWLEKELKGQGVRAGEVRREHATRINKEAARHAERVKRASEQLAGCHEDRARDQHETATGHSKGRGKLSWEVWLVVRNIPA